MISAPTENERTVMGMAEYIEREAAYEDFEKCNSENPKWTPSRVKALIARQKAADVATARHGRWIEQKRLYYGAKQYECSLCWEEAFWDKHRITEKYPCCPNCGAKMDLEV